MLAVNIRESGDLLKYVLDNEYGDSLKEIVKKQEDAMKMLEKQVKSSFIVLKKYCNEK